MPLSVLFPRKKKPSYLATGPAGSSVGRLLRVFGACLLPGSAQRQTAERYLVWWHALHPQLLRRFTCRLCPEITPHSPVCSYLNARQSNPSLKEVWYIRLGTSETKNKIQTSACLPSLSIFDQIDLGRLHSCLFHIGKLAKTASTTSARDVSDVWLTFPAAAKGGNSKRSNR
ncbi:hypothetical protein RRG08_064926 [Elysia crispata]|uniref:Uncharacterized protein n=1 Tax=Elysia crispata TaxID=231223 RepID=A0AAE1CJ94_9GAST|nr:hypothetical protein RRG08_064926 [Elysia crispata]